MQRVLSLTKGLPLVTVAGVSVTWWKIPLSISQKKISGFPSLLSTFGSKSQLDTNAMISGRLPENVPSVGRTGS